MMQAIRNTKAQDITQIIVMSIIVMAIAILMLVVFRNVFHIG